MIKYLENEFDKEHYLKNIIVDYVFLSSLNNNYIGSFIFPYLDNTYNFDLINFYKNYNGDAISESILIGENNLQIINFDDSMLEKFVSDIQCGYIVFDPKDILFNKVKKYKCDKIDISNILVVSNEYITDINTSIYLKNNERMNMYLKVYYSLVDYYYILLNSNQVNIAEIKRFFKNNSINMPYELKELHADALMDAMSRNNSNEEDRFFDEEKIKLYTNIINSKSNK